MKNFIFLLTPYNVTILSKILREKIDWRLMMDASIVGSLLTLINFN